MAGASSWLTLPPWLPTSWLVHEYMMQGYSRSHMALWCRALSARTLHKSAQTQMYDKSIHVGTLRRSVTCPSTICVHDICVQWKTCQRVISSLSSPPQRSDSATQLLHLWVALKSLTHFWAAFSAPACPPCSMKRKHLLDSPPTLVGRPGRHRNWDRVASKQ